ncbi:MAG: hypothetical protein C0410_06665 [Anaerolinea sp.]|nr:hypothetical protein [Anaerolinea sp.]
MDFSEIISHGKSLGEMIRDLEMDGKLGHFKNCNLFQIEEDSECNKYFVTRDFWIEAGVNQTPIFKRYLGNTEQKMDDYPSAVAFVKPVLDNLSNELMAQIKTTNTDLMLRKLFVLYEDTYAFYCKDHKIRTELSDTYSDFTDLTLESNRNITLTLLDGLSIMIENCIAFQRNDKGVQEEIIDVESSNDLFDCDLFVKTYLYALMSKYYTFLNLSKNAKKNYTYCSGIVVNPNDRIPIEGIVHHPQVYTSVMIMGNQNALAPEDEKAYYDQLNTAPIGQGFQTMYSIGFLEVMASFTLLNNSFKAGKVIVLPIDELKKYIKDRTCGINPDNFIEHFSITKVKLQQYISEKDPYIFKVGSNQHRLDICPIVLLDNGMVYISPAAISKARNMWMNFAINGGRPYTGVDTGHDDAVIDGFGERENQLGDLLVDILYEKLIRHYPDAKYKAKDVKYDRIFGEKKQNYGDYDIVYFVGDELFLIESKYFSDSFTANLTIGDYNKIFRENGYYKHCRARYDLVEAEPEKMRSFINATGPVKAHYLFISSKPLEVEFQDEDKIVTFLSVANFDMYIDAKLISDDGEILRPTHRI